jgi:hypothetical protein
VQCERRKEVHTPRPCPPSPKNQPVTPNRSNWEYHTSKSGPITPLVLCAIPKASFNLRMKRRNYEEPFQNQCMCQSLLAKCGILRMRRYLFGKIPAIFPPPPARLCRTIISAAAAAARRSFCRLLSLRYRSASGRIRRILRIMSSLGSA